MQSDPKRVGGIQEVSAGIALGLRCPRELPILGEFCYTLWRLGNQQTKSVRSVSEDSWYKPAVSGVGIDRQSAVEIVCRRYDITYDDILRVEALLRSVESLPSFVCDPVFVRLGDVDYG
jgi:hypothetical protein